MDEEEHGGVRYVFMLSFGVVGGSRGATLIISSFGYYRIYTRSILGASIGLTERPIRTARESTVLDCGFRVINTSLTEVWNCHGPTIKQGSRPIFLLLVHKQSLSSDCEVRLGLLGVADSDPLQVVLTGGVVHCVFGSEELGRQTDVAA